MITPPKKKTVNGIPDPPAYLDQNLVKRWKELAPIAVKNGSLTPRTVDSFARYIIAEQEYLRAVQRVLAALRTGNVTDAGQRSMVQDRFFREMQSTSRLFGLSPDALL